MTMQWTALTARQCRRFGWQCQQHQFFAKNIPNPIETMLVAMRLISVNRSDHQGISRIDTKPVNSGYSGLLIMIGISNVIQIFRQSRVREIMSYRQPGWITAWPGIGANGKMKSDNVIHGPEVVAVSLVRLSNCIKQDMTINNDANLQTNTFRCTIACFKLSAKTSAAIPHRRLNAKTSPKRCHKADKSLSFVTLSHLLNIVFAVILHKKKGYSGATQ